MNALVPLPRVGAPVTLTDYQRMREAVAAVATADEAKAWADKAAAASFYARQIKDDEVETWLTEIRRRAEVSLGRILLAIEPLKGGRPTHRTGSTPNPTIRQTVVSLGMEPATATRLMQLAGPRDEDLQAVGRAAAETYYATARDSQEPATRVGLQAHISAAVQQAMGPEGIRRAAKDLHAETQARKREQRDTRLVHLGERTRAAAAALGSRLYNVLYLDPPTRFETYSAETGMDRAADNHYPTMSDDELRALQLPLADDVVVFLWTTGPKLAFSIRLLEDDWGLVYKSNACWTKGRQGTGYWFLNEHELLLVGTRGAIPAPFPGTQCGSHFDDPSTEHSVKPDSVRRMIERFYPTLPKLEMFARRAAPGWDVWGNEVAAPFEAMERTP